jgi:hypothetical protein
MQTLLKLVKGFGLSKLQLIAIGVGLAALVAVYFLWNDWLDVRAELATANQTIEKQAEAHKAAIKARDVIEAQLRSDMTTVRAVNQRRDEQEADLQARLRKIDEMRKTDARTSNACPVVHPAIDFALDGLRR